METPVRTEDVTAAPDDAAGACITEAAGQGGSATRREALRTLAVGGGVLVAASLLRPSPLLAQTTDRTRPQLVRPADGQLVTVEHGAVAATPRPANVGSVYWKGTVPPANGAPGDL
jgi:hypothetical protein